MLGHGLVLKPCPSKHISLHLCWHLGLVLVRMQNPDQPEWAPSWSHFSGNCNKGCVEIDNKGKRNRGFPNCLEQQRVRRHPLIIFIFSQAWSLPKIWLTCSLASSTSHPSDHLYFTHFYCTPPVSLGSRASWAETYLLPFLVIFTCSHFIQEVKGIIFPGQLSSSLSPHLMTSHLTHWGEKRECSSINSNSIISLQMWVGLLQNFSPLMLPCKILKTSSK